MATQLHHLTKMCALIDSFILPNVHITRCYSFTAQHNATQHNIMQHKATQHNAVQHNTTQYNSTQHSEQNNTTTCNKHNNTTLCIPILQWLICFDTSVSSPEDRNRQLPKCYVALCVVTIEKFLTNITDK
jgi:hypothetical protein